MFDYNFHWRPVMKSLPDLLDAAFLTLQVAVLAMVLGIIIGLCLALIRMHMKGPIRWLASCWVELARNTPALFQLFFFGFGLGAFGLHLSPYMIVLAGLTFNCAGYLAENFRGGFNAVPDTQLRASRSLGMTAWQAYTRIVIPQVFRIVYHPITNQMVWAVLMSSLGMLVGFRELSGETQFFASRTFRIFEYFAVTAVIYYVIVKLILIASRLLATRLFRY
ncbi:MULTISPECIES: amino acid ABC transporter permease [Halocynthiibacter]|uniref:Amino acid ABC transporter permease n=1 Tax=Halocynthiibacter halioticoli TaxID=2986804 RepID=A0AAE3J1E6_9RHOB|nr:MULTISPECIES: amino acid ABC transporter permease [Halocynthiibacter]MCV6823472.1 amino acid ABC transporter permease [Halocynthiibacter halioticoli]MCW4056473.1 amino acid ABC transporter permease [Halocynthiibacter sp. SDUM655004]MDE0590561.1 amino acid ABC transporter permease [Halocynthiibacter sp. C4]